MGAQPPASGGSIDAVGRDTGLDGLRGVAVIAVLLFHQGFGWARGGYLGVSLFFTLSGFLITRLLLHESERSGRVSLRAFWGRRLRRLAPAALLTIALVCVYGALLATESQRLSLRGDLWATLADVTNWRFVLSGHSYTSLAQDPSPVQHFWSLAIEEQFYVVFPLLLAGVVACCRRWRRWSLRTTLGVAVLVLMGASLVAQLGHGSVDREYYGTDTRAFELLAGVLLACWWRPGRLQRRSVARHAVAGAGLVAAAVVAWWWGTATFGSTWLFDGGFAVVACVSVVVIAAAMVPGPVRAVGAWEPLVAVGMVSYGLYLLHWPVFLALDGARTGLQGWSLFGLRVAVTAALALASFFLLEQPFRHGAIGRVRLAPVMWIAAIAAIASAVPLVVPTANPLRVVDAAAFARAKALVASQHALAGVTTASTPPSTPPPTMVPVPDAAMPVPDAAMPAAATVPLPPPAGPMKVYVVGDSTAVMFAGGLALYGNQTGATEVRSGAEFACPVVGVDEILRYTPDDFTEVFPIPPDCQQLPFRYHSDLATWRPDAIVVMGGPSAASRFHPSGAAPDDWVRPTDPRGRRVLQDGVDGLADELAVLAPGVPQLWLTSPYIDRLGAEQGRFHDPDGPQVPAFTDAYNQAVRWLALTRPFVGVIPWAEDFNRVPTVEADTHWRPDGVHIFPEGWDEILTDRLFAELAGARAQVAAAIGT